jgi:radical SAM superfamily enzyme YgiQ (UPF0313 family)
MDTSREKIGQLCYYNTRIPNSRRINPGALIIHELLEGAAVLTHRSEIVSALGDEVFMMSFLAARHFQAIFDSLKKARIPYLASDRTDAHPIVIVGGGACFNPEPVAPFVDVICVGDGDDFARSMLEALSAKGRQARIDALSELPGAYVPHRRKVVYDDTGFFIKDILGEDRPIVPAVCDTFPPILHKAESSDELILTHGCRGTCHFCSIAWQVPYRERPKEEVFETIQMYPEVMLTSTNFGGISYVSELIGGSFWGVGDMRVDDFVRKVPPIETGTEFEGRTLEFGIEGISERLRKILGKPIKTALVDEAIEKALAGGCRRLKLMFIRGVPTENDNDWNEFFKWFWPTYKKLEEAGAAVEAQFTPLTRQPHTPLQWAAHEYNSASEMIVKSLREEARRRKRASEESLLYVTPSRRYASWLIDIALQCGNRNTAQFVWAMSKGAFGNLQADRNVGRGVRRVKGVLKKVGLEPDLLLAEWPVDSRLPWSMFPAISEKGEHRRLTAYHNVSRLIQREKEAQASRGGLRTGLRRKSEPL